MSLFFYLCTFAINLWLRKFVTTADITPDNNQHGIQRRGQDFDKKFVFEGVHSKEVDRHMGTVDRRPGRGRAHSARTHIS